MQSTLIQVKLLMSERTASLLTSWFRWLIHTFHFTIVIYGVTRARPVSVSYSRST